MPYDTTLESFLWRTLSSRKHRLTRNEFQRKENAYRAWVRDRVREVSMMLWEMGIARYTISRKLFDAFRGSMWPHVYCQKDIAEEHILGMYGVVFFPRKCALGAGANKGDE